MSEFTITTNWSEFRSQLAEALRAQAKVTGGTTAYINELIDDIDSDYEGAPICGGSMPSLHEGFEEEYLYEAGYMDGFGEVLAADWLRDWLINSHPGLCPKEQVEAIDKLLDWGGGW
jgi:hypothetical protein